MGTLAAADLMELAGLCQSWSQYVAAVKHVKEHGMTITTPKGFLAKNPMVTIMNEAWKRVHEGSQQFGLTPASRSRVHVSKTPKAKDGKEKFFKSKTG